MTMKTPGVWNDIPAHALVRAEHKGTVIVGTLQRLDKYATHKIMHLAVPPFGGGLALDTRDQWEVTYETKSFSDVLKAAPIGTVWGMRMEFFPRYVKISHDHVTRQGMRQLEPEVKDISLYDSEPAEQFVIVTRAVLDEQVAGL